jgi:uncharacterized protein YajQ (UPF0234 family)
MPSFDFTSEADMVALKNAIDVAARQIDNRYDFKGTSAKVEFNEKDKVITLHGDSDFQLDQIKDILFPAMEKKEEHQAPRSPDGAESLRQQGQAGTEDQDGHRDRTGQEARQDHQGCQAQGAGRDPGRCGARQGAKRDDLQDCIALIRKEVTTSRSRPVISATDWQPIFGGRTTGAATAALGVGSAGQTFDPNRIKLF